MITLTHSNPRTQLKWEKSLFSAVEDDVEGWEHLRALHHNTSSTAAPHENLHSEPFDHQAQNCGCCLPPARLPRTLPTQLGTAPAHFRPSASKSHHSTPQSNNVTSFLKTHLFWANTNLPSQTPPSLFIKIPIHVMNYRLAWKHPANSGLCPFIPDYWWGLPYIFLPLSRTRQPHGEGQFIHEKYLSFQFDS